MHGGSGETACKMYEFQGTNEHKQSNDLTHNYENEVDFKVTMSLQKKDKDMSHFSSSVH